MNDVPTTPHRLLAAMIVAFGLAWVPFANANACSCARLGGLPEAIAQSDVAFIGTMVAIGEDERLGEHWETTRVAFEIHRANEEMPTPAVVNAWLGLEAGCGLDMAVGEEWLVIGHLQDGRVETNLCSGSMPLDGLDEQARDVVATALDVEPLPASGEEDSLAGMSTDAILSGAPLGLFVAGGAVLLIAIVSLAAFRRTRPG
jgi:hypothetical protein